MTTEREKRRLKNLSSQLSHSVSLSRLIAAVHDNPTVGRQHPWHGFDYTYFAYKIEYSSTGQILSQGPVAGPWINMVIMDKEDSGGHTHLSAIRSRPLFETGSQSERPGNAELFRGIS
jgi:hypothetical protein